MQEETERRPQTKLLGATAEILTALSAHLTATTQYANVIIKILRSAKLESSGNISCCHEFAIYANDICFDILITFL